MDAVKMQFNGAKATDMKKNKLIFHVELLWWNQTLLVVF